MISELREGFHAGFLQPGLGPHLHTKPAPCVTQSSGNSQSPSNCISQQLFKLTTTPSTLEQAHSLGCPGTRSLLLCYRAPSPARPPRCRSSGLPFSPSRLCPVISLIPLALNTRYNQRTQSIRAPTQISPLKSDSQMPAYLRNLVGCLKSTSNLCYSPYSPYNGGLPLSPPR